MELSPDMTPTQIRALRKRLGLNCAQFGALVGVSGRTVEDWEQGRRVPGGPAVMIMQML